MKIKYFIPIILGSLLFMAGFTSCDDDEKLDPAPRLFAPIVKETTVRNNTIELTWDRYEGTSSYKLELSKDTFKTAAIKTYETTDTEFTITDLEWDTEYQVGIKGIGNNIESNLGVKTGLKTQDYPTNLLLPTSDDVIDNAIRVKWNVIENEPAYTSLLVTDNSDVEVKTVELTAQDYASGEMIINGLVSKKTYKVKAYTGSEYKGKRSFTTLAAQDIPEPKVDLRGLDPAEANGYITTAFVQGLEDGTTVILDGGTVYKISGTTFGENAVKFITGYSFKGKAEFAISSDIKLPGAGTPNKKLEFEGIYFYTPDADETTANYGGKYVFNLNPGLSDYIKFEKCKFEYFRGVARLQGAACVVGKMEMNNCEFNRIGGYALMNVDNAGATLNEMVLTNSTITYADKVLVNSKSDNIKKVTVNNCTFCYVNFALDFNGRKPAVEFKNSIVGPNAGGAASTNFRIGSGASVTVEGVYTTADYVVATNDAGVEQGPIPDAIKYTQPSQGLWADPLNLDFTIVDAKFPGLATAGDPRWR